jgi:hypothetical protein
MTGGGPGFGCGFDSARSAYEEAARAQLRSSHPERDARAAQSAGVRMPTVRRTVLTTLGLLGAIVLVVALLLLRA